MGLDRSYESDHTQWMREWLAQHPRELEEQKQRPCPVVGQAGPVARRAAPRRRDAGAAEALLLRRELTVRGGFAAGCPRLCL